MIIDASAFKLRAIELEAQIASLVEAQRRKHENEKRLLSEAAREKADAGALDIRILETRARLEELLKFLKDCDQLSGKSTDKPGAAKKTASSPPPYRVQGPTALSMHLLFSRPNGLTHEEWKIAKGDAFPNHQVRKIASRLVSKGHAHYVGNKLSLTEEGIEAWQSSPLLLFYAQSPAGRNNRRWPAGSSAVRH